MGAAAVDRLAGVGGGGQDDVALQRDPLAFDALGGFRVVGRMGLEVAQQRGLDGEDGVGGDVPAA